MAASPGAVAADPDVVAALAASNLRHLRATATEELLRAASMHAVDGGRTIHPAGDTRMHLELVVHGLARVLATAPDGRTMTIRYCRPGALVGALSLYAERFELPVSIQALVDTRLVRFAPTVVQGLVDRDPSMARALLVELSERALGFIEEIPGNVFATVEQRVARHLLDLASDRRQGTELVAIVTQQELAEAGGTAREVVARVLRDLREAGIVATSRDRIVLLDPVRLVGRTYGERAGHAAPVTQVAEAIAHGAMMRA